MKYLLLPFAFCLFASAYAGVLPIAGQLIDGDAARSVFEAASGGQWLPDSQSPTFIIPAGGTVGNFVPIGRNTYLIGPTAAKAAIEAATGTYVPDTQLG